MNKKLVLTICVVMLSAATSQAYKMINIPDRAKKAVVTRVSTGDCTAGSSQTDLYINDVRARMLDDGDKWWNLSIAYYQVPQVPPGVTPTCSIFAGSIWVGGVDAGGQLKIAAATYRQNGNDWFPGPIPASGVVNQAICSAFDNHWQVFGSEITGFIDSLNMPGYTIPSDILMWPGQGNANNPVVNFAPGESLAPFYSKAGDLNYNPQNGDYPIIQPSVNGSCIAPVYGDQMIWWVYNDIGNIHTESAGSVPIDMEVKEESWAYKTNDYINDMTFYHYRIENDALTPLNNTYVAQWVDPDLGWYLDDYAGCDTTRNLGIDYNGEAVDGPGTPNYGDQPPLVGTTFFQGPSDTSGHILKMSSFFSYVNNFTAIGNPTGAQDYYDYLSGFWLDGTPITEGGDGHGGTIPTHYMYPSDPPDSKGWSECSANDPPNDVRYIQDAGPFTLEPGAVNDIVVGAVWVQPPIGTYPCPSFLNTIDPASDEAQALFNGCFQILAGPNAPDVTITELNQELVVNLVNTNDKNVEGYNQTDETIKTLPSPHPIADSMYKFEGYVVYQLINDEVPTADYASYSAAQLNPTEVKQIAECDIKDGVGTIINFIYSADAGGDIPTTMVQGADQGLKHTFDVTTDAFAQGSSRLINFQPYYFSVISYAYNNYKDTTSTTLYDSIGPGNFKPVKILTVDSQPLPYLAGEHNIAIYSGIPHMPSPEANGTQTESYYGEGPFITREEGQGNGGNILDLTQATVNAILSSPDGFDPTPTYQQGEGPIVVKVIDPKRVPADSFSLSMIDNGGYFNNIDLDNASTWLLTDITLLNKNNGIESPTIGDTIHSDTSIVIGNEQVIPQWGISIYINQVLGPGYNCEDNDGFLTSDVVYALPRNAWLSGLANQSPPSGFHWILSGTYDPTKPASSNPDDSGIDDCLNYDNVIGGTWAPYILCSANITYTPIWSNPFTDKPGTASPTPRLASLNSIDVVFTSDESLWSRCVVVEENDNKPSLGQGGAAKMNLRDHANWNGGIDGNGNPVYSTGDTIGMSYFPGYAINLETGQRLNIFFGEDSWLVSQNGADMLWDPTSNELSATGDTLLGGQHYIYVSSTQYDRCNNIYQELSAGATNDDSKEKTYDSIEWVGMTMLAPGSSLLPLSQGLIPGEATVQIRESKPYATFAQLGGNASPVYNWSMKDLAADTNDLAVAKNALDSIEVVPNPYYAYSNYEQSQLDNEIKFTNLPQVCTITIYTLDGQLVNTINYTGPFTTTGKFNNLESTNWNLTNTNNIPVASGVYLIYFSAPGLGTRCIKWFGIRRPVDLSDF